MNDVVVASTNRDAAAAAAVEQHHAEMAATLGRKVEDLVVAVAAGDAAAIAGANEALVGWCLRELLPHALAEEKAMYPAAHDTVEGRLLVTGMLAEHGVIVGLVEEVAEQADPVRAAAAANALLVMFQSHLAKENELVLPLLASKADVSVAELLAGMHELLGGDQEGNEAHEGHEHQQSGAESSCGHGCACGETDGPEYPELDVREVPHAIRHATVLGALEAIGPGGGLVLVAPHDPLPLLAQIGKRFGDAFVAEYLERGPSAWRIAFLRRSV
jgi:uncharacterized protein (DUF2249 family)